MSTATELATTPFEYGVDILLRLQALCAADFGETDQADDVRVEMEAPWRHLSPLERRRLDGLSADLFMLTGEEILATRGVEPMTAEQWRAAYEQARGLGDEWRVLELLRHPSRQVGDSDVAADRSLAYQRLGMPQVAVAFAGYAWEESRDTQCRFALVELLLHLGHWPEAMAHALDILQSRDADTPSLLAAGQVLLRAAHTARPDTPPDAIQNAVRLFERALAKLHVDPPVEADAELVRFARTAKAACHLLLARQAAGAELHGSHALQAVAEATEELLHRVQSGAEALLRPAA